MLAQFQVKVAVRLKRGKEATFSLPAILKDENERGDTNKILWATSVWE